MSSGGNRVIQVVKAHTRMIKFLHQGEVSTSATSSSILPVQSTATASSHINSNFSTGDVISDIYLPQKYRRKPIDEHEMEYITRGGPE